MLALQHRLLHALSLHASLHGRTRYRSTPACLAARALVARLRRHLRRAAACAASSLACAAAQDGMPMLVSQPWNGTWFAAHARDAQVEAAYAAYFSG